MNALDRARAIEDAAAKNTRRIDYDRMNRVLPKQKAALTRAIKSGDLDKLVTVIRAAVTEWNDIGQWPDNWNRWQIALDDMAGMYRTVRIETLAAIVDDK